jgi:hypothetical protein
MQTEEQEAIRKHMEGVNLLVKSMVAGGPHFLPSSLFLWCPVSLWLSHGIIGVERVFSTPKILLYWFSFKEPFKSNNIYEEKTFSHFNYSS